MLNLGLAAVLVVMTGCGSISSRWRGDRGAAYPGVKLAAESGTHYTTEGEWIAFVDVPLSAVLDTLMLPYDISKTATNTAAAGRPGNARSSGASSSSSAANGSYPGGYLFHPHGP